MTVDLARIPMVLSPNRQMVERLARDINWIVIHDMEWKEHERTAEDCAAYFSRPTSKVSAHFCVDSNSIVQCVPLKDVAWAAPGANRAGIQIELAGYARQTLAEWNDAYSTAMLVLTSELVAQLCKAYGIPAQFVDAAGLKAGRKGITTHAQVSKAFGGTHTDPGPNFPLSVFVSRVQIELKRITMPPPPVITFLIVNNGKLLAESDAVEGVGAAAERVRLDGFMHNRVRLIQATLATDPDASLQLVRKVTVKSV